MERNVDVVMPFNLVMRIKDIPEDEIEDYVNDIQMALSSMFYSTDADDDHFEIESVNSNNKDYRKVLKNLNSSENMVITLPNLPGAYRVYVDGVLVSTNCGTEGDIRNTNLSNRQPC